MENKPILYYFHSSFYSQKVLLFLKEKEVEFKSHIINIINNENQSEWYLKINPRGEVPSMRFEDEIIIGSDNIIQYVENHQWGNQKSLYPTDPEFLTKHNYFLHRLEALPIDAITFGTAFWPNIRRKKKLPIKWPIIKRMKKIVLNRSETLRKKAEENLGTPAESALLEKAEEHEKRLHLFTNEEEHKLLLREVQTILLLIIRFLISYMKNYGASF